MPRAGVLALAVLLAIAGAAAAKAVTGRSAGR
jgi:hypothetical protein